LIDDCISSSAALSSEASIKAAGSINRRFHQLRSSSINRRFHQLRSSSIKRSFYQVEDLYQLRSSSIKAAGFLSAALLLYHGRRPYKADGLHQKGS